MMKRPIALDNVLIRLRYKITELQLHLLVEEKNKIVFMDLKLFVCLLKVNVLLW